jgi:hypothetical protein
LNYDELTRRLQEPQAQTGSRDEYLRHKDWTMNDKKVDNGVNVAALLDAREALRDAPEGPNSPGVQAASGSAEPIVARP